MQSYFLTYGRGMKRFVLNELISLTSELDFIEENIEGKLVFRTSLPLERLRSLKTTERLFSLILFESFHGRDLNCLDQNSIHDLIERQFKFDFNSSHFFHLLESYDLQKLQNELNSNKKQCKPIKFRVDCKQTGKWKRMEKFKKSLVEFISNRVISSCSHFEVDLNEPDFLVSCNLTDLCLIVGLPISKETLSVRSYIKNVGLRSTICAAMIQTAELNLNNEFKVVLDPFCGQCTIQNECMHQMSRSELFFLCSDSSLDQLNLAKQNFNDLTNLCFDLCQSSLNKNLPFPYRDNCVDLIITDLPFGKKHPVQNFAKEHSKFYRDVLVEFNRLLVKQTGIIVLLVNSNETIILEQQLTDLKLSDSTLRLSVSCKYPVSLGETNACIFKIINI